MFRLHVLSINNLQNVRSEINKIIMRLNHINKLT